MSTPERTSRRKLLHTRHITCTGYEREDGLYDIEARMQDFSAEGTELYSRSVEPGGVIHDMHLCMTVDSQLVIHHMEAGIAESPMRACPEIGSAYAALIGVKIGPGFTQKVKTQFGGASGCTHLSELLGPLATTAYQTLFAVQRAITGPTTTLPGTGPIARPKMIDSCYSMRADGEMGLKAWPLDRRLPAERENLIARTAE